ncbi:MAG: exonuclease domain-containing protein [Acholeplasmataceae bacterium]
MIRVIVLSVDYKKRLFYAIINNKKYAFYLTNRMAKIYLPYLGRNVLVDFKVGKRQLKRYGQKLLYIYGVDYFNQIISLNPRKLLYDINLLRADMKDVLNKYDKFLFIDFEMTMPGFRKRQFKPEIIQVGYYLVNKDLEVIKNDSYYLLPKNNNMINKRTINFLSLNEYKYYGKAKDYHYFYNDLEKIINAYNPKLVVWGKNDIDVLQESYKIHQKKALTNQIMFIDLLKLHKDYYNLVNDLGLFDAYQRYYQKENLNQVHDAKKDAYITKLVFKAFKEVLDNH